MQTIRHSVYLIVALGSIALAACQPHDRFTDAPSSDIAQIADASAQLFSTGMGPVLNPERGLPQRAAAKSQ